MDWLYPLRVIAGRQLTPIGIRRAKKNYLAEVGLTSELAYEIENDEIVKTRVVGSIPFGLPGPFTERRYTMDGRLKSVAHGYGIYEKEKTTYDPPGRFIGKRVLEDAKKAA